MRCAFEGIAQRVDRLAGAVERTERRFGRCCDVGRAT